MSSAPQETETGGRGPAEPLGLAVCALFIFAAIDFAVSMLLHALFRQSLSEAAGILLMLIVIPLIATQIALAAIWLVYAWPPLPFRMVTAVIPVAMVCAIFWRSFEPKEALSSIVGITWFVLAMAVPCGLARAMGWEIRRFPGAAAQTEWPAARRPRQFTLRQMFAWTSAVALVGGLSRLTVVGMPDRPLDWLIFGLLALTCGSLTQATVWAALGHASPWPRLAIVALVAFFLAFIPIAALSARPNGGLIVITLAIPATICLTGGLMMYVRANGFRLRRAPARTPESRPTAAADLPGALNGPPER